jgi:hypothetical protein
MASRSRDLFLTVRSEGAILPPDFLERVVSGDGELEGLTPEDYHLAKGEKLNEVISRSWNRLLGAWVSFRNGMKQLLETDSGTSITRERWLQPLFQELGYGRLLTAKAIEIAGKPYPISHRWNRTPIHLLGCRVELDRPTARLAGASRSSPHSLVQEALNRSREFVWGVLSNGLRLRILRDNASLTRQAYVEFDLEAMMLGENYADFVLLWLLCHQSRVEAENPHDCWLEKWSQASKERGVRALEQLRQGVERAITALGRGFLTFPSNRALRERLRSGSLNTQDYYRQLLRLVYRFLFLFSAEDRGLLLSPGDQNAAARERFLSFYSTARLRRLAERRTGTRHTDLYTMVRLIMGKLGTDTGYPELALPALGSFLFSPAATPDLDSCELANLDLCDAIRALAITIANGIRRPVDYKNLGPEELGSVYESLLELHPRMNLDAAAFELGLASGHERKTTGSYYTPTSLVDCLLNSALDPVLDHAVKKNDPAEALLRLKVVDPACGSGHFLIAAAHRIAKRLAIVRTGDDEPSPEATRTALRDVIGHCIYGLDVNPMAVELCKVNLWMDALEPGKPLSFLEHRIQCGNALLGTTPALMSDGIPDEAFITLEGDDREACTKWKKVNKVERTSRQKRQDRIDFDAPWLKIGKLAEGLLALDSLADQSIESIHEKERLYEQTVRSGSYLDGKFLADAWCAAFLWKKNSLVEYPITEDLYRQIERNPAAFYHDKRRMADEIKRLAEMYQLFHWHLCFPDVFRPTEHDEDPENSLAGWRGGFDVVLGNPPWERIKLQEKEWFASRHPDIAGAPNAAARRRMIVALEQDNPALLQEFRNDQRIAESETHLIRNSGRFPLCGRGDINTYAIFAETNRSLLNRSGRVGCIVPSGIATDNTTKEFFASLIESNALVSLYDFENAVGLFEGVGHGRFKFCLLTMAGGARGPGLSPDFFFFAHNASDLDHVDRHFTLTQADIVLINPNTRTCPIFRSQRDAKITTAIYRRVPVLVNEEVPEANPWAIRFQTMFHMSNDSHLFRTRDQLVAKGFNLIGNVFSRGSEKYLPLYEAKMMHHFTHRFGDYAMHPEGSQDTELPRIPAETLADPNYLVMPRYWVEEWQVIKATSNVPRDVLEAVETRSEELARQILSAWLAGYLLGREHAEVRNSMLAQTVISVWDSLSAEMRQRFAEMALHEEYRLDETDLLWDVAESSFLEVAKRLVHKRTPKWLMGFRKTARSSDVRTMIATLIPLAAINDKIPLLFTRENPLPLVSNLSSFALDYVTRQKVGGTDLSHFYVQQIAVLPPSAYSASDLDFIRDRSLELICTNNEILPVARASGYAGAPFRWDEDRRLILRCELDALFFHLYGVARADVDYIMDTFPIVRRKDEQRHGEYRTKRVILEIYDAMTEATTAGVPYQTRLNPQPAHFGLTHAPMIAALPSQIAPVPDHQPILDGLRLIADNAWATPPGVSPENVALFAMIDALQQFRQPTDSLQIRMAALLIRKPALALAFLGGAERKEWLRIVGTDAKPLPANVISISQFQIDALDHPWAESFNQLSGSNALITHSGVWAAGPSMPESSGENWVTGRAGVAVRLVARFTADQTKQNLERFVRSVDDGTPVWAVS